MGELDDLAKEEEAHNDEDRCNICNKRFWNTFFSPRYPGLFLILLFVLLDTIYACIFILMSTYYDNFSNCQHIGYFTQLWANILTMIAGFLSIHFLTLSPAKMKLTYCLFLHGALIIAIILGIVTISMMLTEPSIDEVKAHTYRYVNVYHRAPYLMGNVFSEKQCCGFSKFDDVIPVTNLPVRAKNNSVNKNFHRVPPSCCKKALFKECTVWSEDILVEEEFQTNRSIYLNTEACKITVYDDLKGTKAYETYKKTVLGALPIFPIAFAILAVLNYYIWYRFPKMPLIVRPVQFLEDHRLFVTCKCLKLRKNLEELKRKESVQKEQYVEKMEGRTNVSDFHMRHNMIMQSIAEMRTLNRELRKEAQEERQLEAARSGNLLNLAGAGPQLVRGTSKHKMHRTASKLRQQEKENEMKQDEKQGPKKVKLNEKPDDNPGKDKPEKQNKEKDKLGKQKKEKDKPEKENKK